AISGVDGQETVETVPVFLGAEPTPTPVVAGSSAPAVAPLTATFQSTCHASPGANNSAPAFQSVPLSPTHAAPVLQLANPASGAVLPIGDVVIEGLAYDPAATDGTGIDRVELFLESRDNGGLSLGSAVPGTNGVTNPRGFRIVADFPST